MIRRKLFMASAIIAAVVITACSDMTDPSKVVPGGLPTAAMNSQHGGHDGGHSRSGVLHVTKECSQYTGLAGGFCTITSSNLKAIKVGTRVIYASDAVPPSLDTDLLLDPPGPGHSTAFGHVVLNLATGQGVVTISGGTGKFTRFHASVAVSHLGGANFAWDGTYSFSHRD